MPSRYDWLQFVGLLILITGLGFLLLVSSLGGTHWLYLNAGPYLRGLLVSLLWLRH